MAVTPLSCPVYRRGAGDTHGPGRVTVDYPTGSSEPLWLHTGVPNTHFAAADQFSIWRGFVLEGVPPELSQPAGNQDQVILQSCLPQLKPEEADELAEMLHTDFLHLIMEFIAAGLSGGGIPQNPFREYEV